MSKNPLFANEIATADLFIKENIRDYDLKFLIDRLQDRDLLHSDRWSMAYDFLHENYPGRESLATGIAYYCEP